MNDKWSCPECEFIGYPDIEESRENTDKDGNRGIEVRTIACPKCGYCKEE